MMQKPRLIIFQVLGIIMLLCGYFLSDQPDSESVMHFDLTAQHVMHGVRHSFDEDYQTASTSSDDHAHRMKGYKHFSFKVILPRTEAVYHHITILNESYAQPLPETYSYLFFEEINPPPPKSC